MDDDLYNKIKKTTDNIFSHNINNTLSLYEREEIMKTFDNYVITVDPYNNMASDVDFIDNNNPIYWEKNRNGFMQKKEIMMDLLVIYSKNYNIL